MKLAYLGDFLSITKFNEVEIPEFTVLTGVNGSGKSQLLGAIEAGKVSVNGKTTNRMVHFNFETFRLENEGQYNGQKISTEIEGAWTTYQQQIEARMFDFRKQTPGLSEQVAEGAGKGALWDWIVPEGSPLHGYRIILKQYFDEPVYRGNQQFSSIFSLIKKLPFLVNDITRAEFVSRYKPFEYRNDFLPQAIGKIIWDYYIKYRDNQVNEFQNEKHNANVPVLTEEQFILNHGEKPWNVINEILNRFDSLEYRIDSPEGSNIFGNYKLQLRHTRLDNVHIDFSSLSSGERILMALVAAIYKDSSDVHFPDLLLLDELDASLHPSMIKNMLNVIEDVFIKRGMNVILVTHSPTTVALVPEGSIFLMNKHAVDRIAPTTKKNALSILTEGYATLEEGMMIFDEIANHEISILTEGCNTQFIEKALEINGIKNVKIITGLESITGKSQLKILFEFFSKVQHRNKVVVVWDCDVTYNLANSNNTFAFIFKNNEENSIAKSGIENLFPEHLFEDYKKTITFSKNQVKVEFDDTRKRDFLRFVLENAKPEDFDKFKALCSFLTELTTISETTEVQILESDESTV